jgi:serine-type D-Ala-D-Ala carboxypeptidase (penicillin-binding protein 5/6)
MITNRLLIWLIAVALALSSSALAHAGGAANAGGYVTKAPRAILLDVESGAILFQKNADDLAPPASMSKLMTLAVLFRKLKDGTLSLDDTFVMSENAWRTGGAPSRTSSMFVPINTTATIDELIKGMAIQSGNDAAIAVAEGISGSEAAFAKLMTAEARRIGLEKSTFANASGLHHPDQQMTARELAHLARHLIETYPEYYPVFAEKTFNYRTHKFINRNPLVFMDIGADGLKTGYVREAGHGVVASAVRDGQRLIAVVMGHETADDRKSDSARLLDWGFKSISRVRIFDDGDVIGHARVWGGQRMYVPLGGQGPVHIALPKFPANQRLSGEIVYQGPLKPAIKAGDQVAMLRVISSTSASAEIPLFAKEDVEPAGVMRRGLDSLLMMALRQLSF